MKIFSVLSDGRFLGMSGLENYQCTQGYFLQHQMITKHEMVMHVSQFVSASYLFMLNWTFFHHYRNYKAFMSLQEMHAQEDICLIQLKSNPLTHERWKWI